MGTTSSTERADLLTSTPAGREIPDRTTEKAPPSVLVVDDESLSGWAIGETLEGFGFEVVRTLDGPSAVRALVGAKKPFDVVVLDLQVAGANLSLLTLLRMMSPSTAVIVTSAFDTPELAEAMRRGARLVLRKPYEMRDLAAAVLDTCGSD